MLVKLDSVKEYLEIGLADKTKDTLLNALIGRISAFVEQTYCDRDFEQKAYTELYDGDGTTKLILDNWPLISVTSVHDDSNRSFGADTLIAATDYVLYKQKGIIQLDGVFFSKGIQNIQVVYKAGFEVIPQDLQQAVIALVADRFRNKENQGIESLRIGSFDVTYGKDQVPEEIKAILDGYARVRVS